MHLTRILIGCSLSLAVCCMVSTPSMAQVEESIQAFDEGNAAYREGRYQEAIDAYEKAVDQGYVSGALYYNLGNAYYRHDDIGQAIRYYEKARLLIPDNRELIHSLDIARTRTVDQFSQLPVPAWTRRWRSVVAVSAGRSLFVFGFLTYVLAIGLVIYRRWTGNRGSWLRRIRAASLVVAVLFLTSAFIASVQSEKQNRAVVIVEQATLHDQPADDAVSELTVHEGLLVDVLQQNETWVEVRLPNGTRGWVQVEAVADV